MKKRWSLILRLAGLGVFSLITYQSVRSEHGYRNYPHQYFYWGAGRLGSDPLHRHPLPPPSPDAWEPEYLCYRQPTWPERALVISALPAFATVAALTAGLDRLGVREVVTFLLSAPLFILAWFYYVGWLLDRWRWRLRL